MKDKEEEEEEEGENNTFPCNCERESHPAISVIAVTSRKRCAPPSGAWLLGTAVYVPRKIARYQETKTRFYPRRTVGSLVESSSGRLSIATREGRLSKTVPGPLETYVTGLICTDGQPRNHSLIQASMTRRKILQLQSVTVAKSIAYTILVIAT